MSERRRRKTPEKPDTTGMPITDRVRVLFGRQPRARQSIKKIKGSMRLSLGIFVVLFSVLIVFLGYSILTYGESWFASPYNPRIQQDKTDVVPGAVYDTASVKLAWSDDKDSSRSYISEKSIRRAVSHVLGDTGGMSLGAQTRFSRYLYGINKSVVDRVSSLAVGTSDKGSDISLTISSALCDYAYDLLDGRDGAAVVINYKTGEILCSVSVPTFDPKTVADDDELKDSALVDRATMGRYPPGSMMKIITAAAAIERGIDLDYTCTGETEIDGDIVRCAGGQDHGKLDLEKAFEKSCNGYFAHLAQKVGATALQKTAEEFGFNVDFNFSDTVLYKSNFELSSRSIDLAWAGIGQYKDLVTPLHMAMISGSVANGGVMMEPKLLKNVLNNTVVSSALTPTKYKNTVSSATAQTLKSMMRKVVESGTGRSAAVDGYDVCGKTGTAEYTEDGKTKNHSWFTGYLDSDSAPYAVAVIVEGGGYGSKVAAPIAGKLLSKAAKTLK